MYVHLGFHYFLSGHCLAWCTSIQKTRVPRRTSNFSLLAFILAWLVLISANRRATIRSISIVWAHRFVLRSPYQVSGCDSNPTTCDTSCHMYEWLPMGSGLVIVSIDHLQTVTASNCNTAANFHTLQITTAHTKPSQSAFTSHFPATVLTNEDSFSVCIHVITVQRISHNCTTAQNCPHYNI
jgi:hypothetical protein